MPRNSGAFTACKSIRVTAASRKQDLHTGRNGNDPSFPIPPHQVLALANYWPSAATWK